MNHIINKPIKKIALIHDLVGVTRAGMMNIIPIMSNLNIEPCPIPTAFFSTHMAYENPVIKYMNGYVLASVKHYMKLNIMFDAVIIGYIGDIDLVDEVIECLKYFKASKSKIIFDPIFADNNKLYSKITQDYIEKIRRIIPYCDVVIPNETEAKYLTQKDSPIEMAKELSKMSSKISIITGIKSSDTDILIATMNNNKYDEYLFTRHYENYVGTGDIFTGLFTSYFILGYSIKESIEKTHNFIYECMAYSSKYNYDKKQGVIIEHNLNKL